MLIRKAYKFKLKTNSNVASKFNQLAGSNRFIWNRFHALILKRIENKRKYPNYYKVHKLLTALKNTEELSWLKNSYSSCYQQTLMDLNRAWIDCFKKNKKRPRFKKKGEGDSFRYPLELKISENKVFIPKIGFVKFKKSQEIKGKIKNATISKYCNSWYISFQVEQDIDVKKKTEKKEVGIDLGVVNSMTLSTGEQIKSLNLNKKYKKKMLQVQRSLSRKKKHSQNFKKQKKKLAKLHKKIKDTRIDFLHKISTQLTKNHSLIVIEDLKTANMSKSSKGTLEKPGTNVKAKSGLNRNILDQGWYEFKRQLLYKGVWQGVEIIQINPKNTSRKCNKCGYTDVKNRLKQAEFKCISCSHKDNADINAAKNILEAGHALKAFGDIKPFVA